MPTERIESLNRDRESLLAHGRQLLDRVVARCTGAPVLVELDIGLLEYVALYVEAVQWHLEHERDTLIPHDHETGKEDHAQQLENERAELLRCVATLRPLPEAESWSLFLDAVEEHLHNARRRDTDRPPSFDPEAAQ